MLVQGLDSWMQGRSAAFFLGGGGGLHPALPAFHLEDVSLHIASFVCISASVVNGAPRPSEFVPKRSFLYPGACSFVPPQRAAEVPRRVRGCGVPARDRGPEGEGRSLRPKKVDGDCRT